MEARKKLKPGQDGTKSLLEEWIVKRIITLYLSNDTGIAFSLRGIEQFISRGR